MTMLGILAGALITNDQIVTPLVGTLVIGFYAAAIAGIGFVVGGVFGTGIAGPVAALFTILTWFVDIIARPQAPGRGPVAGPLVTLVSRCWCDGTRWDSCCASRWRSAACWWVRGGSRGGPARVS